MAQIHFRSSAYNVTTQSISKNKLINLRTVLTVEVQMAYFMVWPTNVMRLEVPCFDKNLAGIKMPGH